VHLVSRATILASVVALVNLLDFLKVIDSIVWPTPFTDCYLCSEAAYKARADRRVAITSLSSRKKRKTPHTIWIVVYIVWQCIIVIGRYYECVVSYRPLIQKLLGIASVEGSSACSLQPVTVKVSISRLYLIHIHALMTIFCT